MTNGKEHWQTVPQELDGQGRNNNAPDDPQRLSWEQRTRCYDLVLDLLEAFENKAMSGDDAVEQDLFHQMYESQVCPCFIEPNSHLSSISCRGSLV